MPNISFHVHIFYILQYCYILGKGEQRINMFKTYKTSFPSPFDRTSSSFYRGTKSLAIWRFVFLSARTPCPSIWNGSILGFMVVVTDTSIWVLTSSILPPNTIVVFPPVTTAISLKPIFTSSRKTVALIVSQETLPLIKGL